MNLYVVDASLKIIKYPQIIDLFTSVIGLIKTRNLIPEIRVYVH